MEAMNIKTFTELCSFADTYRDGKWIYRGLSDCSFELISKIGRSHYNDKLESHIFRSFCRELSAYDVKRPDSEWEALALAQHHGLPTRLLDWTENPLVAAFFACRTLRNTDGAIYALKTESFYDDQQSPFKMTRVAKYRPRHITRRITAQRGLFTIHPEPSRPLPEGDSPHRAYSIRKHILSWEAKERIMWDLSRFNINSRSLFPDLDGLADFLSWAYFNEDPALK